MTFEQFAQVHGLLIRSLVIGRWVRVPTEDKPKHRNGAYKFMGDVGFVQNWATMTEAATWHSDGESKAVTQQVRRIANQAQQEARVNAQEAAQRAERILSECELATHPYLASKGFHDELVNVWNRETDNVMVVPMRVGDRIIGAQLIKPDGEKKFLYGQRSEYAEFIFGQRGMHVLCEGYATALSTQRALAQLKLSYVLHVCFSAGNLKKVAARLPAGLVIADHDLPTKQAPEQGGMGWKVAREIGWAFWTSDTEKEDANDYAQRCGVFALAMGIRRAMVGRIAA